MFCVEIPRDAVVVLYLKSVLIDFPKLLITFGIKLEKWLWILYTLTFSSWIYLKYSIHIRIITIFLIIIQIFSILNIDFRFKFRV